MSPPLFILLVFFAVLGALQVLDSIAARSFPRFPNLFAWVTREITLLPYAIPMAIGFWVLYWQAFARNKESPNPTIFLGAMILASVGLFIWRSGARLVERISEIGPVKFVAGQEELAYLQVLSRIVDLPKFPPDHPTEWIELEDAERKDYEEFFESVARVIDAIRTTTVVAKQDFWVQKSTYELMYKAAYAAYLLGRQRDALAYYEELSRVPGDVLGRMDIDPVMLALRLGTSYSFIADTLSQRDRSRAEDYYRKSIGVLEQLVRGYPTLAKAHYNLGWLYDEMGDLADAIKAYDRAIEINQTFHLAHYNKACALTKRNQAGDLDGALNELRLVPQGHRAWTEINEDNDLENLRQDPLLSPVLITLVAEKQVQPIG